MNRRQQAFHSVHTHVRAAPSTVRTWYIPRKIAYGELLCWTLTHIIFRTVDVHYLLSSIIQD